MIFSKIFEIDFKKFQNFEDLNTVVENCEGTELSGNANLASKYDCSNPCSFRDMTFF